MWKFAKTAKVLYRRRFVVYGILGFLLSNTDFVRSVKHYVHTVALLLLPSWYCNNIEYQDIAVIIIEIWKFLILPSTCVCVCVCVCGYDGGMWYQGTSREWVLILSVGSVQLRITLNGLMLVSLSCSALSVVGPSVDIGSFVCGCGRIFHRRGDLTHHQWFCGGQLPQPRQMEFHCGGGRIFRRQGDLTRHQWYYLS